jgi:hypothetical protein
MKEPMMSRYGNHFERAAILEWLNQGNNFCPVTGNPLRPSNLISDKTLQWKIDYWAKKHNVTFEEYKTNNEIPLGYIAVPQERFICPLTNDLMEDPVMTKDGYNFERKAILKWLDEKEDTCPVSKKSLKPSGLVANGKLKWEIQQWQLYEGDPSKEMSRLELESKLSKAEMVSRDFALSDILRALTVEDSPTQDSEEKAPPMEKADVLSVLDDVMNTI